ncbi:MAG: hypothetical protein ACPGVO_20715 [Spirulinaceae cyanobacterium]
MGRQAKRKRQRRADGAAATPPSTQPLEEPQKFVRNFAQRGYALQDLLRSPSLPETEPKPEV